jgi:DNA-binding beta-propeller fold protein YncE
LLSISKKKLKIIIASVSAVVIGAFAYFYFIKQTPVDTIKSIPIGDVSAPPEYAFHIFGDPEVPIQKILGITVANNLVYATDTDAGMVHVFDKNGKVVNRFGKEGTQKLMHPYGITNNNGTLYVGDGGIAKILMYDLDGNYIGEFKAEERVSIPSQMVIKNDRLYAADLATKKVYVFDLQGKLVMSFGGEGEEPGQFLFPHGIAVNDDGQIYIADSGNNLVSIIDQEGKFIDYVKGEDGTPMEIGTPRGLSFDAKGNLYVVAGIENMVYTFNPDGEFLFTFNELEEGVTLGLPSGISIDGNYILLSETESSRIAVYKY